MPVAGNANPNSAAIDISGSPNRGPAYPPMDPNPMNAGGQQPPSSQPPQDGSQPPAATGASRFLPQGILGWGSCIQLTLLITAFALACSCAPTSDWMNCDVRLNPNKTDEYTTFAEIGLWKICLASDKKVCEKIPGKYDSFPHEALLVSARVFNFLTIIFSFLTIVGMVAINYYYRAAHQQPGLRKAAICCCVTNLIIATTFAFASWTAYMDFRGKSLTYMAVNHACDKLPLAGGWIRQIVCSVFIGCVFLFMPCWAWKSADEIPKEPENPETFGPFPADKNVTAEDIAQAQAQGGAGQPGGAAMPMYAAQMGQPLMGTVVPPPTPQRDYHNPPIITYA